MKQVQLQVTNRQSPHIGKTVTTTKTEWASNSYWVAVVLHGEELLLSRHFLSEN